MATQLTSQQLIDSDIEAYLRKHEEKELLRFVTVGSVDDGKSTLIGRLLYESHGVYEDQLASVKKASEHKGSAGGEIDFALITDGLRSEREQGITIDVAYRYFNTEKRKFIIADTPGHVQYTRNMATGASTADVGIILIDARQGILQQSRRHAYIASLLGIPNLLVAINKMDLVDYSPERYEEIAGEFQSFAASLIFTDVTFIPVSALMGDNVVHRSERTAWYQGKTILEHLETVPIQENIKAQEFYFPVQYVIRPNLDFRGFSGTIASGEIGVGEEIIVLPSGKSSRVKKYCDLRWYPDKRFSRSSRNHYSGGRNRHQPGRCAGEAGEPLPSLT
jgi:sulfate adenylyltransferase large subunit